MRYRFESDGDGHNYLLPETLWALWDSLNPAENENCWLADQWSEIEQTGIDGIWEWVFENPEKLKNGQD